MATYYSEYPSNTIPPPLTKKKSFILVYVIFFVILGGGIYLIEKYFFKSLGDDKPIITISPIEVNTDPPLIVIKKPQILISEKGDISLNKFVPMSSLMAIDTRTQILYQPTGIRNITRNIRESKEVEYYYLVHPASDDESVMNEKETQKSQEFQDSCGQTDPCHVVDLNDITSVQDAVNAVIDYIYWLHDDHFDTLMNDLSDHNSVVNILYPLAYNNTLEDRSNDTNATEIIHDKIKKDKHLRVSTRVLNVPDVMHTPVGAIKDVIINTNIFPLLYAIQLAAMVSRSMEYVKPEYIVSIADVVKLKSLKQVDYATNQYRAMYTPQSRTTAASTTPATTTAASGLNAGDPITQLNELTFP